MDGPMVMGENETSHLLASWRKLNRRNSLGSGIELNLSPFNSKFIYIYVYYEKINYNDS